MVNYPRNWNEIRRNVYRRDNWTCQKCGSNGVRLYAHHIRPLSKGGGNSLDNLTTLCKGCHRNKHPHMLIDFVVFRIFFGFIGLILLFGIFVIAKPVFFSLVLLFVLIVVMKKRKKKNYRKA